MDPTACAVVNAFGAILGQRDGDRRAAEQQLRALEVLEQYPLTLLSVALDEKLAVQIRQMAGLTLKQYVNYHWDAGTCETFRPPQPSDQIKMLVRDTLLDSLGTPIRLIRSTMSHILAAITELNWSDEWPIIICNLGDLLDKALAQTDPLKERESQDTIHGILKVLVDISGEVSDLEMSMVARSLMPGLIRTLCNDQRFGSATRQHAATTINNLVNTALNFHDDAVFRTHIGDHLKPFIEQLLNNVVTGCQNLEESTFQSELLQLITVLCVDAQGFVIENLNGGLPQLMNFLWQLLQIIPPTHVKSSVSLANPNLSQGDAEHLAEPDDVYDSDGELVEYENLVYSLLQFVSRLVSVKRYRIQLDKHLPDACCQLVALLQLPDVSLQRWLTCAADFLEDTEELLGCSVRHSTMDVIKKFSSQFKSWPIAFHHTLQQLFASAESEHSQSHPHWWKFLEVALHLCASFPEQLVTDKSSSDSQINLELLYSRFILPSLQQSDLPFLQASALNCLTQLYIEHLYLSAGTENLPKVLADALSSNQPAVVRLTAVRSLSSNGSRLRHLNHDEDATATLRANLPALVTGVVDALSIFGEPLLDDGLYALHHLLLVDPSGFTMSTQPQITSILVDLFKHCYSVSSTLWVYLDVLRCLLQANNSPSSSGSTVVQDAFMPLLLPYLEQPDTFESLAVEAALRVYCVFIRASAQSTYPVLIQRIFPAVVHIAITNPDTLLISVCCDVLRCFLAASVNSILEWHDDEGNNGISYILHVTSRLLDPSGPIEWSTAAGRLVCAIVLQVDSKLLGENLDLLLRGTLARLSTLPNRPSIGRASALRILNGSKEDENNGAANGASQSLVFVFVVLCRLQPKAAIDFLSTTPDLTGQPVIGKVMKLWCTCQPFFFAREELCISISALTNILTYVINSRDSRLMQITVEEEFGESNSDTTTPIASRTRNARPSAVLQLPLPVKMYKLLIQELSRSLEENDLEDEEEEDDEDDDEHTDGTESQPSQPDQFGCVATTHGLVSGQSIQMAERTRCSTDELDDLDEIGPNDPIYSEDPCFKMDIKEHLCDFFRTLAAQPFYIEFSRFHTQAELDILTRCGVILLERATD